MTERGFTNSLSGPSGVGKGTVRRNFESTDNQFQYSVSMTDYVRSVRRSGWAGYFFHSEELKS